MPYQSNLLTSEKLIIHVVSFCLSLLWGIMCVCVFVFLCFSLFLLLLLYDVSQFDRLIFCHGRDLIGQVILFYLFSIQFNRHNINEILQLKL